jgi:hypothetical protein
MNFDAKLARKVVVASITVLLLSSLTALPGCGREIMRTRYQYLPSMDGGVSLTWSRQPVGHPGDFIINSEIYCISAADAEHAWATRSGGEIDALDNGNWKQVFTTHPGDYLFGVSALDSRHVWVVGQEEDRDEQTRYAAIWFFDGTSWKQQANREFKGVALNAVYALGTKHVWAVGTHGTILFFDGSSWTRQKSGTRVELQSVSAVNPSQVWISGADEMVGGNSALLFYNGKSWKTRNPGSGLSIGTISAIDGSQVWALGESDTPGYSGVYYFNGSSWVLSLQDSPEFIPGGVCAPGSGYVWVTGTGYGPNRPTAKVAFFDGRSWNIQEAGADPGTGFGFVAAADPSHLWAVGRSAEVTLSYSYEPSEIYFGTDQP